MTALIRARGAVSEMARRFDAVPLLPLAWQALIWPGEQVPVVTSACGDRQLKTMRWGLAHDAFQQPITAYKRGCFFARDLVTGASRLTAPARLRRCLIAIESFARPDGTAGRCTREWHGLWDDPLTAWAGLADEEGCAGLVHADRASGTPTPHLLRPDQWQAWLGGAGLLSLGPGYRDTDFYREDLGELWSSGRARDEEQFRRAA